MQAELERRLWLHLLLFLATCGTTFLSGALSGPGGFSLTDGLLYMAAIMSILLVHEMGHYTAARHHGVEASLPYFLPLPLLGIGTLGAVIRMREPPSSRAALLDIGAAGPLAGVLIALPVCFLGLQLSPVQPLANLPAGAGLEGNSFAYLLLKHLAHPAMGPQDDVYLHPLAWAGWLGLLVTSLNLLPVGQLDGGHVVFALLGPRWHRFISRITRSIVLFLGVVGVVAAIATQSDGAFGWLEDGGLGPLALRLTGLLPWLVWFGLLCVLRTDHPPVFADAPLGRGRRAIGWSALGLLCATFTPVFLSRVSR